MEPKYLLVLENSLLRHEILSYLNKENLGEARFVSSKWAEDGESILARRNLNFVLNSSIWANRKSVREFNSIKLNWMGDCLNLGSKFWLLERVEFPIRDLLEVKEIRNFLENHGHLIQSLRLVKYEGFFEEHPFKISADCSSPLQLLHLILTSWCPNLTSLSIVEKIRKWSRLDSEHRFPRFNLPEPVFKEKLKLESLTIELEVYDMFLSSNIPISYFQEIFRSSPNLKCVRAIWAWANGETDVHKTDELLFPEDEDFGLYNLENLELPYQFKNVSFLNRITMEKFPRLKNLNIGFRKFIGADEQVLLNHAGVKKVTLRTRLNGFEAQLLDFLELVPQAYAINFVEGFGQVGPFSAEMGCPVLFGCYGNIQKIEVDSRQGVHILCLARILGSLCPNLELCKMKRIAVENEGFVVKKIAQIIIDTMGNLRQFELEYFGKLWVVEEWEELRGHLNTKLEEEGRRFVHFYFGSEDFLKTRTRFGCANTDLISTSNSIF